MLLNNFDIIVLYTHIIIKNAKRYTFGSDSPRKTLPTPIESSDGRNLNLVGLLATRVLVCYGLLVFSLFIFGGQVRACPLFFLVILC